MSAVEQLYAEVEQQPKRGAEYRRKRHRAHIAVERAIKKGTLVRPDGCSLCGIVPGPACDGRSGIHAHHESYDRPLDVRWLCVRCHGAELNSPQSEKTHCPRGHLYDVENTYYGPRRGERRCRECARIFDRKRRKDAAG